MAIIKNATPFDSVKKKFAKSDEIHFKNRAADNATIGVRMKHPSDGGHSTKQISCRDAFKAAQEQVKTIMADEDQKATYQAAFKKQNKYMYLRDYIFAQVYVKPTFTE